MIQSGMVLGGMYRIIQEIGQGGTGVIYLAYHLRLEKKVVVKKIKDHFAGQVNGRAEADILKQLHHSYLPQVYDFLVVGGSVYTVMEYIEGRDLQYYLDRNYCFPEDTVRKWLLQLTEVLDYLHSQKPMILHSDIKPANIMITSSGDVCLIDFNISLDGETSKDVQGISPWYAAPEQYERAQHVLNGQKDHIFLDGRMDIYSLGTTFYRVMTGNLPSPVEDQSRVLMYMDIPYSDGLKNIIARMIRPRPSGRYASAAKVHEALEDISKADPVYRRYGCFQIGIVFAWVLCVMAGVLCIYYGSYRNSAEKWQEACQGLYLASETDNETTVISEGTSLLSDASYRTYLNRNPAKKAEVLNIVGESYYRQEQYQEASRYYREAWQLSEEEGRYLENYVAALIRDGQLERARQMAESSEGERLLSGEKRNMIRLEIAWMSGETQGAQEELEELAAEMADMGEAEDAVQAYLLLADIYTEKKSYADAVAMLEDALPISTQKDVRRKLGETAYLAAQECDREADRNVYLVKALENYEILNESGSPSYEDALNLALVQRSLGKYESSNVTLRGMLSDYPDNYILPMWMCYNYLDIAKEQDNYQKVKGELQFRYQDCERIYLASGAKDGDMEQLEEVMEQLEE